MPYVQARPLYSTGTKCVMSDISSDTEGLLT